MIIRRLRRHSPGWVESRRCPVAGLNDHSSGTKQRCRLPFKVHPHMLRHACGFALAIRRTDFDDIRLRLGRSLVAQRRSC